MKKCGSEKKSETPKLIPHIHINLQKKVLTKIINFESM